MSSINLESLYVCIRLLNDTLSSRQPRLILLKYLECIKRGLLSCIT